LLPYAQRQVADRTKGGGRGRRDRDAAPEEVATEDVAAIEGTDDADLEAVVGDDGELETAEYGDFDADADAESEEDEEE